MSFVKQLLVLLVVLLITNAATFAFVTWRCRQELEDQQRLTAAVAERATTLEQELDDAEAELDRLSIWGDFIRLQQDLNALDAHINRLNFGNAITELEAVAEEIRLGGYGELFRERRAELLPLLEEAKHQLRNKSELARQVLVEFNDRAFEILSGISATPDRASAPDRQPERGTETSGDEPSAAAPSPDGAESSQAPPDGAPEKSEDPGALAGDR